MTKKIFRNARIFTPVDKGKPLTNKLQGELAFYERGVLILERGLVMAIGDEVELSGEIQAAQGAVIYDCDGKVMIPGFVDPHTHCCFANLREYEFYQRIQGVAYLEILERGGGILSSVEAVRNSTEKQLFENSKKHVMRALSLGTTTMEIKSGYGLTTDDELKMLRVIGQLERETPLDIMATFLGAHAIPEEFKGRSDDYIEYAIDEMVPAVMDQGIASQCDVFCEKGVFSLTQSRRLLESAIDCGMKVKLHADEVHDLGGAGLAADLGALSADHLLMVNDENIKKMRDSAVIANLLPATAYSLRKPYARARDMIENDVAVALATDCNPGSSFTESMQFVIGLAVLNMGMTPDEALTAATLNAAYSIGLQDKVGSLSRGKNGDFLLVDGLSPAILAYHAGCSSVAEVYKRGEKVA